MISGTPTCMGALIISRKAENSLKQRPGRSLICRAFHFCVKPAKRTETGKSIEKNGQKDYYEYKLRIAVK